MKPIKNFNPKGWDILDNSTDEWAPHEFSKSDIIEAMRAQGVRKKNYVTRRLNGGPAVYPSPYEVVVTTVRCEDGAIDSRIFRRKVKK